MATLQNQCFSLFKVRRALQPCPGSNAVSFCRDLGSGSAIYDDVIVRNGVDTVTKAFEYAVNKYRDQESLLSRRSCVYYCFFRSINTCLINDQYLR
jgi:hypothetical protein